MRRRYRPRARKVVAPVLVLAGLAGFGALLALPELPAWLIWAPAWLVAVAAAVCGVVGVWWFEPWALRRQGEADRERLAVDQLRRHLGRRDALSGIGRGTATGLALRVHPAIPLAPGDPAPAGAGVDPGLPDYVDREVGPALRAWMRTAATQGGFLLLVGNSSVGKTRLLYEAARAELPDYAVLAPDLGDGALVNTVADATFALPKLIVWLDELQRFLDGPYLTPGSTAISAATIRRLLDAPTPVVVVGTLWPEYATKLRALDVQPGGPALPWYPAAVDILGDRRLHQVAVETFSEAERAGAAQRAGGDPRLARALADRDFNVTETLAGAHELVRRHESGTEEQKAVLHAAVDARRLGIQAPLTGPMLAAAARGHLDTVHPDDTWFGPALTELTSRGRPQDRSAAPLIAVPNADRTAVVGYTVADYLLQRLTRQRRTQRLPAVTWQALIDHTGDREDVLALAESAANRLLYRQAEALLRPLADAGDGPAVYRLADIRTQQTRTEDTIALFSTLADAGHAPAAGELAARLATHGRADEAVALLRRHADGGDVAAASQLVNLLAEHGHVDELRTRADAGDGYAASRLAELLTEQGDPDQAVELLRGPADAGHVHAASELLQLLTGLGRVEEALDFLRARADTGDESAAHSLAMLLAQHGHAGELRTRAEAGNRFAAYQVAVELAAHGHTDELRARADAGDGPAAFQLASLLAERGHPDEAVALLSTPVGSPYESSAHLLANLLAQQGRSDELRARADAGDAAAAGALANLLATQGDAGELRGRADAGDVSAEFALADLLERAGRMDEFVELLRARTEADPTDMHAAIRLVTLLAEQGHTDELRARADTGDMSCAQALTDLLAEQGRTEELRSEVYAGTYNAGRRLISLLSEQGESEPADRMRRFGLNPDGSIADGGPPGTA